MIDRRYDLHDALAKIDHLESQLATEKALREKCEANCAVMRAELENLSSPPCIQVFQGDSIQKALAISDDTEFLEKLKWYESEIWAAAQHLDQIKFELNGSIYILEEVEFERIVSVRDRLLDTLWHEEGGG